MPIFSFISHCFYFPDDGSKSQPSPPICSEVKGSQLVPLDSEESSSGDDQQVPVESKVLPRSWGEPVPVISELPSNHDQSLLVDTVEINRQQNENSQDHKSEIFRYSELEEAIKKFDSSKMLGSGGYGTVYYGILKDGRHVAIKRMHEDMFKSLRLHNERHGREKLTKFMDEIAMLTRLRHENLVQLYGCTSPQTHELLLVQEYVPNGTVSHHLLRKRTLSWPTRLNIAVQTANALAYLHAFNIIHRDVKTCNILLDGSWNAKVVDFGLSRIFPDSLTHVTTDPTGTPGYIDPEYYANSHLSDKSDVYSFGVVLIELISSQPAFCEDDKQPVLSNFAMGKIVSGKLHHLVDPTIGFQSDNWITETVSAVAQLAFMCLQRQSKLRPSMAEVLKTLESIRSGSSQKSSYLKS